MAKEKSFHIGIKALITNNKGKILLLKVNPDLLKENKHGVYWDIPGGRIEEGHSVEETLRREVEEETGVTQISEMKFFYAVVSNIEIPVEEGHVGLALHIYTVTVPEEVEIILNDEHVAYDWFESEEAAELLQIKYPNDFTEKVERANFI